MIIKILLIGGAMTFALLVMRERVPGQHELVRRMVILVVTILGIVAVLWPDLTVVAANAIGVTRGTDLVLYLLVLAFVFNALTTSQRLYQMGRTINTLARELALARATAPEAGTQPSVPATELSR